MPQSDVDRATIRSIAPSLDSLLNALDLLTRPTSGCGRFGHSVPPVEGRCAYCRQPIEGDAGAEHGEDERA